MATNVYTPNGLVWSRNAESAATSGAIMPRKIKKGYATAIGIGDLVKTGSGANQGYIVLSVFNDTSGLGVFQGVNKPFFDLSTQASAHGLNGSWPTTANPSEDVICNICGFKQDAFRVYAQGGPWVESYVGQNVNWLAGSNGAPGISGYSTLGIDLTTVGSSNTLPFRILGVVGVPGGPQDPANINPQIEVCFNPAWLEGLQGTGI